MKKLLLSAVSFAVIAVTAMVAAPTTSEAVPGFARQTGAACLSCHFQAIPRLTAFGRNFSMTGMRDVGETGLIEDDHLSLPAQFQASFLMKIKLANQSGLVGAGNNNGLQMPDESALFVAGRVSANAGTFIEISMNDGGTGVAHAKFNYVIDTDAGFIRADLVSHGAGLGQAFSDPSNTVRHTNRSSQQRAMVLNATQMMNAGVAGVGLSTLISDSIYLGGAVYAVASPGQTTNVGGGANWGSLDQVNPYVRGAYIAEVGGLEAIVGGWWTRAQTGIWSGMAATPAAAGAAGAAQQYGIDLQLQGDVGDLSIGLYVPWVLKGEAIPATGVVLTDNTGFQAMLTVAFGHAGIKLGYDRMTTETLATGGKVTQTRPYVGAWYSLAQNIELDLAYTSLDTGVAGAAKTNNTTLVVEYLY